MVAIQRILLAVAMGWPLVAGAAGAGGGAIFTLPDNPSHEVTPDSCYVLLKPKWPDIQGEDISVCRAVLDNFNKFCNEPPQYDRRVIHPTTADLLDPNWKSIDVETNLELVKQTYLATILPEYRESVWASEGGAILAGAASCSLRLWRAEIGGDLRGALQTVFMLENTSPGGKGPSVTNQPRLMFSAKDQQTPTPLLRPLSYWGTEDLVRYRDHWYLTGFDPHDKLFEVKELLRPRSGTDAPVVAVTRCTIQHVNDRQRSE